jgi:hypothetical protein
MRNISDDAAKAFGFLWEILSFSLTFASSTAFKTEATLLNITRYFSRLINRFFASTFQPKIIFKPVLQKPSFVDSRN